MVYVELGMDHWHTGKRSKKYYTRPFDISDELWNALKSFAESNSFCSIGVWDYDKGKLYMARLKELDKVFDENCSSPHDYMMFDEIRREPFGGNINVMEMRFKYEYFKVVQAVNLPRRKCLVKSVKGSTYEIDISDRCVFEGIKPKDTVLVRKFLNDVHMAVQITEKYVEPSLDEIEQQKRDFEDLSGGY